MHRALIYSIPGSGTRFTADVIERMLGPIEIQHVDEGWKFDPEADNGIVKTVVPLRSPVAVYLSRRGGHPRDAGLRQTIVKHWATLRERIGLYDYLLFPMAAGLDRAELLQSVIEHLDTEPDTDVFDELVRNWRKVGNHEQRPELVEYEQTGNVVVDGKDMGWLDDHTDWYDKQVATIIAAHRRTL